MIARALSLAAALALAAPAAAQAPAADPRARPPSDEVVYFVLPDRFENGDPANDRGGLAGDRLATGFDPAAKGFFHGGDLAGLTRRLDYIQALGATAIWFAPIFANKVVQGPAGNESAGYHGYWVTDFTRVDPHFGSNAEFKAFVDAAHARGMKVYMDIITNHTADVIRYREGAGVNYEYRGLADYPYTRRGGVNGRPINRGFAGDDDGSAANFARLTNPDWAYRVYVPKGEERVKVPAWLNDPLLYHNRGNSSFTGEDSNYGDFSGLDDLFTEHPRVVAGMIDIYGGWIDRFGIDGFRIDTARHVNPEFWQAFVPAMQARAKAKGIPHFTMFGEVFREDPDAGYLAQHTRRDRLPAVLDFAFQASVRAALGKGAGTEVLAQTFAGDVLYEGGEAAARDLPTFLGNHDMGRFSTLLKADRPGIGGDELLARTRLGHAMLMLLRGAPVIYYGDEQGFVGDGGDQDAREDMFASRTAVYTDNVLIGTRATNAQANFNRDHPLFREIAALAKLRAAHPALRGGRQRTRHYERAPGMFAVSRFDPASGREYLIAFNTSAAPITRNVLIGGGVGRLDTLRGRCPARVTAPGSARLTLPAFGHAVCAAQVRR